MAKYETIKKKAKEKVGDVLEGTGDMITLCDTRAEMLGMAYSSSRDILSLKGVELTKRQKETYGKALRKAANLGNTYGRLATELREFKEIVGRPDISGYKKNRLKNIRKRALRIANQMENIGMKREAGSYRRVITVADVFLGKKPPVKRAKKKPAAS
ncbi:MAG: hypothetical protein ACE5J7_03445 [Candidatus Aenigmatarchaeota archaeon]